MATPIYELQLLRAYERGGTKMKLKVAVALMWKKDVKVAVAPTSKRLHNIRGSITCIWKEKIDILKVFNGIYKFIDS